MKHRKHTVLVPFFLIVGLCSALSPSSYLSPSDKERLKLVLEPGWSLSDIAQILYSSAGYKHLGLEIPNVSNVCAFVKNSATDGSTIETLFYAASAGKVLGCPISQSSSSKQLVSDAIREGVTPQELYFAVLAAADLGINIDNSKALKVALQTLKKDDSILSLGYIFHVGSKLKGDVSSIFERIEDAIVQADEVDGRMLQFEGGLSITALVLTGAYKLAEICNKPLPINPSQAVKFASYLISRKSVQLPKGVYYFLEAVSMFTNNKYHIPVATTLASNVAVSHDSPKVQVRVTDLMGSTLNSLTVTADSVIKIDEKSVILQQQPMTAVSDDKSLYELDIISHKPPRGFYQLVVSAKGSDSRLVGHTAASLTFKVLTAITIKDAEVGTVDVDQSTTPNLKKISFPSKLSTLLEADQHQKVILKFSVKDSSSGKATVVHQAFVKTTHTETGREVIFVAEADSNSVYKFDMDVGGSVKDFGGLSGEYRMELIIGDASISNPVLWWIANVKLIFPEGTLTFPAQDYTYKAKPEINHLFHSPDPRPPSIVSNAFTILCILPLLILLGMWAKLGVNILNFTFSWDSIGFHLGLGSIFVLFYFFWLHLDMFTSLKYLMALGVVTFLSGNSMLSKIAAKRKETNNSS